MLKSWIFVYGVERLASPSSEGSPQMFEGAVAVLPGRFFVGAVKLTVGEIVWLVERFAVILSVAYGVGIIVLP